MLSRNRKISLKKYDYKKKYTIDEAIDIVRDITYTKFDSSFDLSLNLNLNFKKSKHVIDDFVFFPHGTGKSTKILVICTPEEESEVSSLDVDYFGFEDYVEKIKSGWFKFDILITTPKLMPKLIKLGKILGPKGLMPSLKCDTVTLDIRKSVRDIRLGKVNFKINKNGILNISIGRFSFSNKKIKDNFLSLFNKINKFDSNLLKSFYIKNIVLSSTMSRGIFIDKKYLF